VALEVRRDAKHKGEDGGGFVVGIWDLADGLERESEIGL